MTGVLALLGLVLVVGTVWLVAEYLAPHGQEREREQIRRDVLRRDAMIARAHRQAREQMNQAAGQDWRNRFE